MRICQNHSRPLINDQYKEPVDGAFDDATSTILRVKYDSTSSSDDSDIEID